MDAPSIEEYNKAISCPDYLVGEGKDRQAYRVPGSRWVYKINKYPARRTNENEYERYQEFVASNRIPGGIFLPEMHMLNNGVVASEYIPGDKPKYCNRRAHNAHIDCWIKLIEKFEDAFGTFDSSSACNVRIVMDADGSQRIYIIDLGE